MSEFNIIGKRIRKQDGVARVTGRAVYTDDIRLPQMLHGKILRSPLAHARIVNIDTSKARRVPGVKAVITAADLPRTGFGYGKDNSPLKLDKVRCIGDEVAAVAAIDENTAEEALSLIQVEYEELPAVYDPEEALREGAPLVHERSKNNISFTWTFNKGDVDRVIDEADVVVEDRFRTQYINACPLEPHICLASFEASGDLTVWVPIHFAFMFRKDVSEVLGIPWSKVRVIQPTIGGSFGSKIDTEPFHFICIALAKVTGKPVKIAFTREEEFLAARPRQPMILDIRQAARKDGTLLARDVHIISDNGAYNAWGSHALLAAMMSVTSLYRVPNVRFVGDVVYTNKPYGGSVRGFGNPQATFAIESQLDILAEKLGMDPLELRLKNANQPGDVTVQDVKITSCGLTESIEKVAQRIGWSEKRGKRGNRGVGLASLIHVGGGARIYKSDGCGAIVKIDDGGDITVIVGSSELGQGSETVQAMMAAEELGAKLEDIRIINSDTAIKPWDVGSHASRSTFISGMAIRGAATQARKQLFEAAASKLEARPEDLESRDSKIFVKGSPERFLTFGQAARAALLRTGGDVIVAKYFYDPPNVEMSKDFFGNVSATYAFGSHAVEVEVDPETGAVDVLRVAAAHDVGRALNPMGLEAQIEGGVAMAVGYATTEEVQVRDGAIQNASLLDYRIPTVRDVPVVEPIIVETVDPEGPFGAKGMGECSTVPTAPAIANAVYDATGVRIKDLPITPEKVLRALEKAKGGTIDE